MTVTLGFGKIAPSRLFDFQIRKERATMTATLMLTSTAVVGATVTMTSLIGKSAG